MSESNYLLVYNMFSLGIASMLFTTMFLIVARERVLPRYRMAVLVSATVTGIAAYHYFRMFDSFNDVFGPEAIEGAVYNVGYRYVDWFLTVPLLLVETVAVLALAKSMQSALLVRLVPAAALMIALGYPGDAGLDIGGVSAPVWGLLSSIPFVYILYVLFIELGKSLSKQSKQVQRRIKELRLLLLATWGYLPLNSDAANALSSSALFIRAIEKIIRPNRHLAKMSAIVYPVSRRTKPCSSNPVAFMFAMKASG